MKCLRCGGRVELTPIRSTAIALLVEHADGTYGIDISQPGMPSDHRVPLCTACVRPATEEEVVWILGKLPAQPSIIIS